MGKRSTARKLAMQAIYQMEVRKKDAEEILTYTLTKDNYIEETKEFAAKIYWGVLKHQIYIDNLIRENAIDWKFDRIAGIDKAILRVGIWELLFTKTSTKVIIAEMIELIRKYSVYEAIKFINGLLGVVASKREQLARQCSQG